MVCWKASASAVRASPTGLSFKSSGNGEPAGVGEYGASFGESTNDGDVLGDFCPVF